MTDRIRITKNLRGVHRSIAWLIKWTDSEGVDRTLAAESHAQAIRRADRIIKRRRRAA